jgi:hypothetical protein
MRALLSIAFVGVAGLLGLPLACTRAEGEPRTAAAAEGPLVLELFTSQGCSSCPPADRLLAKLASTGSLADRRIAALAFHVDYWNDLGWADPYSLPAWTERQPSTGARSATIASTRPSWSSVAPAA